jgi:hypothetical protein
MLENKISPANTSLKAPLPPTNTSQEFNTVSSRKVQSLQLQVQSLHDAFQYQEELLALKTKQSLTSPQYTHLFQRYAAAQHRRMTDKTSSQLPLLPTEIHSELLQSFPYFRLLTSWRQKALQSTLQQSVLQASYQTLMNTQQQERQMLQQQKQEQELLCLKHTQTIQAYQLQIHQLTNDLQASQQSYEGLQISTNQLYAKYVFYYKEYMKQAQYFVQLHEQLKQEGQFFLPMSSNTYQSNTAFNSINLPPTANTQLFTALLQKLTKYEQKLIFLQGQIEKLSVLLQQKEIYYRNSVANQELLKRLQLLRYQKQLLIDTTSEDHSHYSKELSKKSGAAGEEQEQHQKQKKERLTNNYFSEIVINAEMEGILKTIFMNLDLEQDGLVAIPILLQAFLNAVPSTFPLQNLQSDDEEEGGDIDERGETCRKRSVKIPNTSGQGNDYKEYWEYWHFYAMTSNPDTAKVFFQWLEEQFTPIGQVLLHSLGRKRCFILLHNLFSTLFDHHSSNKKISWGEFVVQCVPATLLDDPLESTSPSFPPPNQRSRYRGRTSLSKQEYLALQHLHLIENRTVTFDYNSLPLAIPKSSTPSSHSIHPTTHSPSQSYEDLAQENKRLKEERHYLLQQLQQVSKQQIRSAEEIKYYFEHEIKVLTKQTVSLQHQLEDQEVAYQQAQQRIVDMNAQYTTQLTHMEEQLRTIQAEYQQVLLQQQGSKEEVITSYETQVQDWKQRYTRLELEHTVLQRENNKKEVKNKALVRDLLRLESTIANLTEELNTQSQVIQQQKVEHSQSISSMSKMKEEQAQKYEHLQHVAKAQDQEMQRLQSQIDMMNQELIDTKDALDEARIAAAAAIAAAAQASSASSAAAHISVPVRVRSAAGGETTEGGIKEEVKVDDHRQEEEAAAYDNIRDEIRYIRSLHALPNAQSSHPPSTLPRPLSHTHSLPSHPSQHQHPHHQPHQPSTATFSSALGSVSGTSSVGTSALKNEKLEQHLGRLLKYVEHLIDDKV